MDKLTLTGIIEVLENSYVAARQSSHWENEHGTIENQRKAEGRVQGIDQAILLLQAYAAQEASQPDELQALGEVSS